MMECWLVVLYCVVSCVESLVVQGGVEPVPWDPVRTAPKPMSAPSPWPTMVASLAAQGEHLQQRLRMSSSSCAGVFSWSLWAVLRASGLCWRPERELWPLLSALRRPLPDPLPLVASERVCGGWTLSASYSLLRGDDAASSRVRAHVNGARTRRGLSPPPVGEKMSSK